MVRNGIGMNTNERDMEKNAMENLIHFNDNEGAP